MVRGSAVLPRPTGEYNMTDTIHNLVTERDMTRDQVIIELVTAQGYTLNKATKAYAAYAKEHGLTAAIVSHKDAALDRLRQIYGDRQDNWTAQAVKDEIVEMAAEYEIAESTARDYCKAFSEELGVSHPVLDPRQAIFEWFREQGDSADKDEYMEFAVNELGRSKSNANEYWKGYELHLYLINS
jgi:hypothetical protein